jgi:hypothetical protein
VFLHNTKMEDSVELQQCGAAVAVAFNLKVDTVKK